MTDRTHPDSGRIITSSDVIADLHARIAELEAQLEAIGAGGVNGLLMGQPQVMPDLTALTERGAVAWAGVDAQALREGRWYMVNKDGMATLCADETDAEQGAKEAQTLWPHMGPHRAVQLVEAGHESAAANAGGEPVAEVVPCHTPSGKRVALRSEAQGLPIGTKLYTHPSPPEGMAAEQALLKVLAAVQRYLPPDGPSAHDTLTEIIEVVDPWPLGQLDKS